LPSRRLSSAKVVQGERNGKGKAKEFHFTLPSRTLSCKKIKKTQYIRHFG